MTIELHFFLGIGMKNAKMLQLSKKHQVLELHFGKRTDGHLC